MIRVGSQRLEALIANGPICQPLGEEHRRDRDRQEIDGKRPDHVQDSGKHAVDETAVEPGHQADDDGDEAADQRRADPDLERGAAAVEHAGGDVAALLVGAEEVVSLPGGADGRLPERERAAALLEHIHPFAVDHGARGETRGERIGVRDVAGVERGRERDRDDGEEQHERRHREAVSHQLAGGEPPGARARPTVPAAPPEPG